jgi:NADH-quinone oxidoreductase subunit C
MALENTDIQEKLVETFGESVFNFHQERDIFSFEIDADKNTAVILFLKNESRIAFSFLNRFMWYSLS